jgi:hypothetical protein
LVDSLRKNPGSEDQVFISISRNRQKENKERHGTVIFSTFCENK